MYFIYLVPLYLIKISQGFKKKTQLIFLLKIVTVTVYFIHFTKNTIDGLIQTELCNQIQLKKNIIIKMFFFNTIMKSFSTL